MISPRNQKVSDRAGFVACVILALACLFAASYHTKQLLPLWNNGARAQATVVDIKRGARGSKWAIYNFITSEGQAITSRDMFQMYLIRPDLRDELTVFYSPDNPQVVTADFGWMTWQGTFIFSGGFLLLAGISLLIFRHRAI